MRNPSHPRLLVLRLLLVCCLFAGGLASSPLPLSVPSAQAQSAGELILTPLPSLPAGGYVYDLASGDLDNDGDLDIIIYSDDGLEIYTNNGQGIFALAHQVNTSFSSYNSAASDLNLGDIDNDGDLDLLAGEKLFLNDGRAHLTAGGSFIPGEGYYFPTSILSDLDGDGDLDAVVEAKSYLNDGRGQYSFSHSFSFVNQSAVKGVIAGDLDHDGDQDLLFATAVEDEGLVFASTLQLFLNNAFGSFSTVPLIIYQGIAFSDYRLGDIDSDGDLDIALHGENDRVFFNNDGENDRVFFNNGSGGFSQVIEEELLSYKFLLSDMNSDGHLDLLTNGAVFERAGFRANDGQGHFGPAFALPISDVRFATGDLDADGDLDLVVSEKIFRNDTPPPFRFTASTITAYHGYQNDIPLAGDLDNDGDQDLLRAGAFSQVNLNDGAGRFKAFGRPIDLLGSQVSDGALGDIDDDGDLDALLGRRDQPSQFYLNIGNGLFETGETLNLTGNNTQRIALFDADGDTDLDALLGNIGSPSQLYLNDGDGHYVPGPVVGFASTTAGFTNDSDMAVGDLDDDGDQDVVFAGRLGGQLYLNDGRGNYSVGQFITLPNRYETTVVLSDVNNDGALDLILGTTGIGIYLNNGQASFQQLDSTIESFGAPVLDLALGDLDSDQDKDLVVGVGCIASSGCFSSRWYLNDGDGYFTVDNNTLPTAERITISDIDSDQDLDLVFSSGIVFNNGAQDYTVSEIDPASTNMYRFAVGDLDNDGDEDLLAIEDRSISWVNNPLRAKVYLNCQSKATQYVAVAAPNQLFLPLVRQPGIPECLAFDGFVSGPSFDLEEYEVGAPALGDFDGDSDLDAVIGAKLYLSDGRGNYKPGSMISSTDVHSSAIGDLDGDSDLDLVTDTGAVYLNNGAALFALHEDLDLRGIPILGDLDNDGDIDVVSGGKVFLNTSAAHFTLHGSYEPIMELGDLDGDGDLDALRHTSGRQVSVLRNDGTGRFVDGSFLGSADAAAISDLDGDSDLDVALLRENGLGQVLLNNGDANFIKGWIWSTPTDTVYGFITTPQLMIADLDADGANDLLAAASDTPLQFFRNNLRAAPRLANTIPHLTVGLPGNLPVAPAYATSRRIEGPVVAIPYQLIDAEGDPVRLLRAEFSLNGGGNWQTAVPATGTTTTTLATRPGGSPHTFAWDIVASGLTGHSDNMVVRLIAAPGGAGPFAQATVSATSAPFRLRGTTVRVLRQDSTPVADALVYRLPAGQTRGAALTPPRQPGLPQFATDHLGYLQGRGALNVGDQLLAMIPISSTSSYTLYHTSAPPTADGLAFQLISTSGTQTLTIAPDNGLVLFNLVIALEWDARNDTAFLAQLERDLRRTSDLLFDWTDGQAVLGDLRIYHDRQQWDDAHIRIYATNRLRPNAVKGGIVEPGSERLDPARSEIGYGSGQIRMGAVWNRYGEATANLGDDWARTLAHELGHFALFLDDNYLGLDDQGRLVPVESCRGAMSDPYRDDYGEFHPAGSEWDANCATTLSERLTGRSDWETIGAFYNDAGLAFNLRTPTSFGALPGPASQPLALPRVQQVRLAYANTTIEAPVYILTAQGGAQLSPAAGRSTRGFLIQAQGEAAQGDVALPVGSDRIVGLGSPTADQLVARGARPGDRVCVFEADPSRQGCRIISAGYQQVVLNTLPDWQPDLRVSPINSTTLRLELSAAPGLNLWARVYPGTGPALSSVALAPIAGGYGAEIASQPELPLLEGLVHIWEGSAADELSGPELRREAVIDFAVGGNPGRVRSRTAPRSSPGRVRSRTAPLLSADGQAILFTPDNSLSEAQFITIQDTPVPPAPPSWALPVGPAYRLTPSPGVQLSGVSLNVAYFGDDVPRGQEAGITLYRWNEGVSRWEPLPTSLDQGRNEAAALVSEPGVYQLMTSAAISLASPGWGLVFFYPGATQPPPMALAAITGRYRMVYGYDEAASEPWQIYAPEAPAWVNDLAALEYGASYWVYATEGLTIPVKPGRANSANLNQDNGILSPPPATYYGTLNAPAGALVTAQIAGTICGSGSARLVEGQVVYSVKVEAASSGASLGCGLNGRMVQLYVDGVPTGQPVEWDNTQVRRVDL